MNEGRVSTTTFGLANDRNVSGTRHSNSGDCSGRCRRLDRQAVRATGTERRASLFDRPPEFCSPISYSRIDRAVKEAAVNPDLRAPPWREFRNCAGIWHLLEQRGESSTRGNGWLDLSIPPPEATSSYRFQNSTHFGTVSPITF